MVAASSKCECEKCLLEKPPKEFLLSPLTPECEHLPGACLRCLSKLLDSCRACPTCSAEVDEIGRRQVEHALSALRPLELHESLLHTNVAHGSTEEYVLFVSMLDGTLYEISIEKEAYVLDLKVAIEKATHIPPPYQRLFTSNSSFELKAYQQGAKPLLKDCPLQSGDVLLLIRVFSEHAGKQSIEGAELDQYGSAKGSMYDLGVDSAFKGMTIAVLHLYTGEGFDFSLPRKALEEKGFAVVRWTDNPPPLKEFERVLASACQLWVISTNSVKLSNEHVNQIQRFFQQGRGVYLWGDNEPYYADANVLATAMFGASMDGNVSGGCSVGPSTGGNKGFVRHLITTAIENLYEGVTIATIRPGQGLSPLLWGSAGNLVAALYDTNGKRAVIDGGFTRLFCDWNNAGTARFVKNVAAWLCNFEADY